MAEANKRTVQQQRIQQLQERLELYNAAATRGDRLSSASLGSTGTTLYPSSAAAAPTTAAAAAGPAKPSRAPPPVNSPTPKSHATPATRTDSASPSPSPAFAAQTASGSAAQPLATAAATRNTSAAAATAAAGGGATAHNTDTAAQAQTPPAPAPAPRLARNLVDDFTDSATASPVSGPANVNRQRFSATTTTPSAGLASAALPASSSSAPPAAAQSMTSPLRASDVFGYYNASDESGSSDQIEYEVEEMEEYEEDDYTEEEEEEEHMDPNSVPPATLDNVLRRIFRAYSQSPDRAAAAPTGGLPGRASASPPAHEPVFASTSAARFNTTTATAAATAAQSADGVKKDGDAAAHAGSTHPLIQRAAELYRQHRLHQAQQLHRSPFDTTTGGVAAAAASLGGSQGRSALFPDFNDDDDEGSTESSMTTSEPTAELNADTSEDATTTATTSSSSASSDTSLSPAAAYAALNLGNAAARASRAASAAAAAAAAATSALPHTSSSPVAATSATAVSSVSASAFDQLELAYRQLLLLQRGVDYTVERAGIEHFPQPLPHQDKAQALAQERNELVQKDLEMRANPPAGAALEDIRRHEAVNLEAAVASIHAKFTAALQVLQPVIDRGGVVEGKLRLLQQREHDLAKQREARLIVEREVAKKEDALGERKERLKRREAEYSAQLQQHDEQQKAAQQHISEVEQLSKQVSSWLAILEERDRRLAGKEKRLQHVQADLMRRNEDVMMWKKAAQRVKQIPPPPSPPRIIQ